MLRLSRIYWIGRMFKIGWLALHRRTSIEPTPGGHQMPSAADEERALGASWACESVTQTHRAFAESLSDFLTPKFWIGNSDWMQIFRFTSPVAAEVGKAIEIIIYERPDILNAFCRWTKVQLLAAMMLRQCSLSFNTFALVPSGCSANRIQAILTINHSNHKND